MRMGTVALGVLVAVLHLGASIAAFLWEYVTGAAAFDGHHVSWLSRHFAEPLFKILWFPLAGAIRVETWFQLTLVANSILWAALLVALLTFLRQRRWK